MTDLRVDDGINTGTAVDGSRTASPANSCDPAASLEHPGAPTRGQRMRLGPDEDPGGAADASSGRSTIVPDVGVAQWYSRRVAPPCADYPSESYPGRRTRADWLRCGRAASLSAGGALQRPGSSPGPGASEVPSVNTSHRRSKANAVRLYRAAERSVGRLREKPRRTTAMEYAGKAGHRARPVQLGSPTSGGVGGRARLESGAPVGGDVVADARNQWVTTTASGLFSKVGVANPVRHTPVERVECRFESRPRRSPDSRRSVGRRAHLTFTPGCSRRLEPARSAVLHRRCGSRRRRGRTRSTCRTGS